MKGETTSVKAAPRRRRWLRRLLIAGTSLVALAIVLAGGAAIFLSTDRGREWVRERAEAQLAKTFIGGGTIGRLDGSVFGDLVASNVAIHDASGEPAVTAKRAALEFRLWPLLKSTLQVDRVALSGVVVAARQGDDGAFNLASLVVPPPIDEPVEPNRFRVLVENVTIEDSLLTLDLHNRDRETIAIDRVAPSKLSVIGGTTVISIGDVVATFRERNQPVRLRGKLTVAGEMIAVSDLSAAAFGADVTVKSGALVAMAPKNVVAKLSVPAEATNLLVPDLGVQADALLNVRSIDSVINFDGTIASTSLTGNAEIFAERGSADVKLTLKNVDLSELKRGLPPSQFTATLRATVAESSSLEVSASGEVAGKRIESARAAATLDESRLLVRELVVAGEDSSLAASGSVRLADELEFLESRLTFSSSAVEKLARPWVDVRGDLAADLRANGPMSALAVSGTIDAKRVRGFGVDAVGIAIHPTLVRSGDRARGLVIASARTVSRDDTSLDDLRIEVASGDGKVATVSARGSGRGASLDVLARVAESQSGAVATLLSAKGGYEELAIESATGRLDFRLKGAESGNVGIDQLVVSSNVGNARLDGLVSMSVPVRGQLTANASALDLGALSRLAGQEPINGTASADVAIDTRPGQNSSAAIRFNQVVARGYPATSGTVAVKLHKQALELDARAKMRGAAAASADATVRAPQRPFEPRSWRGTTRQAVLAANASATIESFAPFTHLHPDIPASGTAQIDATQAAGKRAVDVTIKGRRLLTARVDAPSSVIVSATLRGAEVTTEGTIEIDKRATVTFSAGAALAARWFEPRAYRGLDPNSLEQATLNARGIDVDWWAERFKPGYKEVGATASVRLAYQRTSKVADLSATLVLPRGGPRSRTISQATVATAAMGQRRTDLTVRGTFQGTERLTGGGEIAFGWRDLLERGDPRAASGTATAKIDKLPLIVLREVLRTTPLEQDAALTGTLSATASVDGSVVAPRLAAQASIDGAVISNVAFASLRAGGSLKRGKLALTATGDQRGGGRLVLHGDTDLSRADSRAPIAARLLATSFDIGFLSELLPDRGVGGLLSADLNASGTRAEPILLGTAELSNGRFDPGAPLHTLRSLSLKATMTGDKIIVRGGGKSGRGRVELEGEAKRKGNRPSSVTATLTAKRLPVDAGTALIRVDTTTKVRGRPSGGRWKLVADIERALIELPDELSRELHPTELPEDIVFTDEEIEAGKAVASTLTELEIEVRANDSIFVRGGQANGIVGANLKVKTGAALRITGTVDVEQGWVEIVGRRYDIRSANVSFAGKPDPSLDVELAHEFSALTLFIDVSGTASDPRVEFRSDPPQYDDSELLAFVLGANPDEPTSPDRTVASQATGVATSLLASQLSSMVTKVTPIDVLRIETEDSSAERVALGKWITEKLLVAYRLRLSAEPTENTNELTFEYRFLKRWLLEGYVGQEESGADVLWIKRF